MTTASARGLVAAAAVLWSTSSVFMRMMQQSTPFDVDQPTLSPLTIAFYRSLFAGLILLILVRPRHITFRPSMLAMVLAFGIMTALYLSALGRGTAANAIMLQNTAPVWIYFFGVWFFRDPRDRRTLLAVLLAASGAILIVWGNWPRNLSPGDTLEQGTVLLMALGSGLFYALVVLFLRLLREESSAWLISLNLLGSAVVILGIANANDGFEESMSWYTRPTTRQLAYLAVFGVVQMALPYVLFSRGLKAISPQEAGIITLIEPLVNPIWAMLIAPDRETPTIWTLFGGSIILTALAWRYWPRRSIPA